MTGGSGQVRELKLYVVYPSAWPYTDVTADVIITQQTIRRFIQDMALLGRGRKGARKA